MTDISRTYGRRAGTSADHGHKFEMDLTILTYLRCLKLYGQGKLKSFLIANNMNYVGAFDDIVCRIEYEENGSMKTKLILVQAKHKENANTQVSGDEAFKSTKDQQIKTARVDPPSLIIKYIKSYLQTRQIFDESEDWIKFMDKIEKTQNANESKIARENLRYHFKCDLEDSIFLYYTNAAVFRISSTVHTKMTEKVTQIFDTSSNTGIHKMNINKNVILSGIMSQKYGILTEDEINRANKFEEHFRVFLNQEREGCLEEIIKKNIRDLINENNIDSVKLQSLYANLYNEIKHYFQLDQSPFLHEAVNLVDKVNSLLNLQFQTTKVLEKYCEWKNIFREEFIKNLYNIILARKFLKFSSDSLTASTTLVKCIQVAIKMEESKPEGKNVLFLYLKNGLSFEMWKKVRTTHCYTRFSVNFLCVNIDVPSEDVHKVWSNDCGENEYVISISDDAPVFEPSLLLELSSEGLKKIMSYGKINFQKFPVQLKDIFGNTICPKLLHYVLNQVLNDDYINLGSRLPDKESIYIERKYMKRIKTNSAECKEGQECLNEEAFLQNTLCNKFTIISDDVGMGKSTALKHLSHCIKKERKDYWVEFIDLHSKSKNLKKMNQNVNPISFISTDMLALNSENKMIFQHKCYIDGNVALLFDGFDEIDNEYRVYFLHLIEALSGTKIKTIVVSTRSIVVEELENCSNIFNFSLLGFNYEDMYSYLIKFWSNKECENRCELLHTLVLKIVKHVEENKKTLTAIATVPLQAKMLASTYSDEIKNALSLENPSTFDIHSLSLYSLYNNFIDMHINRCIEEKHKLHESSTYYRTTKDKYKNESDIWEAIACKEIFSSLEICDVKVTDTDLQSVLQIGIIVNTHPVTFLHRSFAEFLAAKHVSRLLYESKETQHLEMIYKTICVHNIFDVVRKFMNAFFENEWQWKNAAVPQALAPDLFGVMIDEKNLFVAISEGNAFLFKLLLRHLSSNEEILKRILNKKSSDGRTLLHFSAEYCELVFDDILNSEYFLCAKDYDVNDQTALHVACMEKKENAVKSYISKFRNETLFAIINQRDVRRYTPMMCALHKGYTNIIKILHDNGASIHMKCEFRWNVLMCALYIGCLETVKYLIQQGAHVNETDIFGKSALIIACEEINEHEDCGLIVRYLLEQTGTDTNIQDFTGATALMHFIMNDGNIEILKLFNQHGTDIEAVDKNGRNAITLAIEYGRIESLKYFLDLGVDIEALDFKGRTIFMLASLYGNMEIFEYFLGRGVDVMNKVDSNGDTCFTLCSGSENSSMLQHFIEGNVSSIDHQNHEGETALFIAVSNGRIKNLKLLITHGASVNICNYKGDTALSAAITKQIYGEINEICGEFLKFFTDIVKYLLQNGAKINHQNDLGNSALHLALNSQRRTNFPIVNLVKFLVEHGANLHMKNIEGFTPIMMAKEHKKQDVKSYIEDLIKCKTS